MTMMLRSLVLLLLAAAAGLASAQTTPAEHFVSGFRSARFGMTADEVRQAIIRDFKPAADMVTDLDNPAERTKVIMLRLAVLEPGPGPAVVSYILGATSRRLVHVNVVWTTPASPTAGARNEIGAAAVLLSNYFRAQKWTRVTGGVADSANGVLLFVGIDSKKAAVELRVSGVAVAGGSGPEVPPAGPAQLRVSYIANVAQPDIATVKPGSF